MTQTSPSRRDELLSGDFMTRLDALDVLSRKILAGKLHGERRGKRRGQSVEFADYRAYVPGDDLRFIDWNLFARLERLFLRLFLEEEDLSVSILLDTSQSMDPGPAASSAHAPPHAAIAGSANGTEPSKLLYAQRVAAALGYIGLVHYNRVHLFTFAGTLVDQLPNLRGRRPVPRMLEFLSRQQAGGAGDLAAACKRFALAQPHKGVVIIISDLLDKGDFAQALRYLAGPRFDVFFLHVLSPQELDPERAGLTGDLRLRDCEDGDRAEVSITAPLLKRYRATLEAYCQHLRDQCARRAITYLRTDTSVPFETVVLRYLRERGLVG